jgi:Transposase DDE domain
MEPSVPARPAAFPLDTLEATLADLLQEVANRPPAPRRPGAPPVLKAALLWSGLLVCLLRGFTAQRALHQLVTTRGLWHHPPVSVTEQALYQRLARTSATVLLALFAQVTAVLRERYQQVCDVPFARFATEIVALDHSTLDAVLRQLKLLRGCKRTDPALIPGQLATLFDVRRQLFWEVEFWEEAKRNEKHNVTHWLERLPSGTLLLFDLGFFSFAWFDTLSERGFFFISRLKEKVTYRLQHSLFDGPAGGVHLKDSLIYLGAYRADRAAQPVRLIEVFFPKQTFRYLTNVLDPRLLPAAHVVSLYRRRWDIESAFNLLKTHLNLFLIWSGQQNVVLQQVFGTVIVAQVVLALRTEVALAAKASLREVSLPLLIRWMPELALSGHDPVQTLAQRGRLAGIIRPFRGREYQLPRPRLEDYDLPAERPPPRTARYAGKQGKPGSSQRRSACRWSRKHGWGLRRRRARTR